jgi:hypothetical protein
LGYFYFELVRWKDTRNHFRGKLVFSGSRNRIDNKVNRGNRLQIVILFYKVTVFLLIFFIYLV